MERESRLRANEDFQRVRREGRSWASPSVVLIAASNDLATSRFGFAVGKRIGKAVVRNQVKRRLREVVRRHRSSITTGWDLVFIAREPIRSVTFEQLDQAVAQLLRRAHVLRAAVGGENHDPPRPGAD